ncbi:MAG TPA: cysteine desulfurase family protein [Saprospiraceae bacterium]|nr:cysteine desulfurase family protein [Saprospiraceae bacterium]
MSRIYFDNAATTPMDARVIDYLSGIMSELWGNPSSIYQEGRTARAAIEEARKTVANTLQASIGEVFFTSCGTESNNMALKCAVRDLGVSRIISSPIEHHAVLHTVQRLEKEKAVELFMLDTDEQGKTDLAQLEELLKDGDKKTLVSLMYANNEIGTMIDLDAIGELCETYGAYFHSDTVQTIGYYPIDVNQAKVHFITGSGHKFHGPKGVGFIYINNEAMLQPFIDGGAQERNMRGGTENLYGILAMAKALELAEAEREARRQKIDSVRHYFAEQLQSQFPEAKFHGTPFEGGHYKILSVSFPESAKSDLLLLSLDIAGISVSGGSACSSGADAGSHVIGSLFPDSLRKTIRFSFSHYNTNAEVDKVISTLKNILQ